MNESIFRGNETLGPHYSRVEELYESEFTFFATF